jgi:hypothetical protein
MMTPLQFLFTADDITDDLVFEQPLSDIHELWVEFCEKYPTVCPVSTTNVKS